MSHNLRSIKLSDSYLQVIPKSTWTFPTHIRLDLPLVVRPFQHILQVTRAGSGNKKIQYGTLSFSLLSFRFPFPSFLFQPPFPHFIPGIPLPQIQLESREHCELQRVWAEPAQQMVFGAF